MKRKPTVVIGGCGFIGAHCVVRLLNEGHRVLCVDNLSRPTAQANLRWIVDNPGWPPAHFTFVYADIRNSSDLEGALRDYSKCYGSPELVIHQAAQVAVTQSVVMPRNDFETNALGTFNVLEAVRQISPEATLIFASTNKVYGSLKGVRIRETEKRYELQDLSSGVKVDQPLDFYSPYGCSKGAADQYVRDYARIFKMRSIVLRQSCIYGCRQFGQEDQGWVAWFVIAALLGKRSTIFGNGKQVRDLLWVDDLVEAYWKAWQGPVRRRDLQHRRGTSEHIVLAGIARHAGTNHSKFACPALL
jgi:CDP-paratose 2-epimerase